MDRERYISPEYERFWTYTASASLVRPPSARIAAYAYTWADWQAQVQGILSFGMGVTLREGDREYFYQALDRYFPGVKQQYIRTFGLSYECPSPNADRLWRIFDAECEKHGILHTPEDVFAYLNAFPQKELGEQLSMF